MIRLVRSSEGVVSTEDDSGPELFFSLLKRICVVFDWRTKRYDGGHGMILCVFRKGTMCLA